MFTRIVVIMSILTVGFDMEYDMFFLVGNGVLLNFLVFVFVTMVHDGGSCFIIMKNMESGNFDDRPCSWQSDYNPIICIISWYFQGSALPGKQKIESESTTWYTAFVSRRICIHSTSSVASMYTRKNRAIFHI